MPVIHPYLLISSSYNHVFALYKGHNSAVVVTFPSDLCEGEECEVTK